jgi:predicted transcriptional regulator
VFEIREIIKTLLISILFLTLLMTGRKFELSASDNDDYSNNLNISHTESRIGGIGGFNWSKFEAISEPVLDQNVNTGHSAYSKIAFENDKIYVVWYDSNDTNGAGIDFDIFYRYFDGNIWGDIQVISEPVSDQDINTGTSWVPSIAVENGKIYVVWYDENNTNGCGGGVNDFEIFYRCNLTGSNWEDIQVISEPIFGQNLNTQNSSLPEIAVENGKIYVVWSDMNDTNGAGLDNDIFYRCNLTGTDWEEIQVISEPVFGQNYNNGWSFTNDIGVENGRIYIVWGDNNNTNGAGTDTDIFFRCNLTGSNWEDIQVISEPVPGYNFNINGSFYPTLAVENGKIYVVWHDHNNTNGAGTDRDIFFRSKLSGIEWDPVQVISEPVMGQNLNIWDSSLPIITVENGKIFTVWQDKNDTNGAGTDEDIFFRCNLTTFSWEDVEVISEPIPGQNSNSGMRFYPSLAVRDSKVGIVWSDTNYTNNAGPDADVFYRYKHVKGTTSLFFKLPKVTPFFGDTSTDFNFTVKYFQLNNTPPSKMEVVINGNENSMLEVDPSDSNYIDGKKYFFKIDKLDIGSHSYEFNASDGFNFINTKLFSNLKVINTVPKIITKDNLTAIEDIYYEISYEFEDIDISNVDQICHWEFDTNAIWLNFNLKTGKLSGTPRNDDVGQYWVYIAVNDTMDIVFTNFTLTVIDINDSPLIVTSNVEVTNEDELYEVDYEATDIDSPIENQFWSLRTNATTWLNFSPITGILNGTPGNSEVGEYWINITVNDIEGGSDCTNFTLMVLNVNDRPEIITKDELLAETDKSYEVDYDAIDIDSQSSKQAWSLSTNATWLSINPTNGVLEGTPTRIETGWYIVNVTVSDGDGGIDWHRFILNVNKGNLPPIITTEDIEIAEVNESYEVDYDATDDRSIDLLRWSIDTNASWLDIETKTGYLSGTPTSFDGGKQYWVNVSVLDTENGLDYHNFILKVLKKGKNIQENNRPRLLNFKMTPSEGDTETEFTFMVDYIDLDNESPDQIQVIIDGIAYNMILRPGETPFNGKYEFITKLSEGEHSYYFTASDGIDINTSGTLIGPNINHVEKTTETKSENSIFIIITTTIIIVIIASSLFIGGTEVGKYKFLSLCIVPLYNKLNRDKVYDNFTRGQIHGYINAKPGEHYNALKSALKLKNGTLTHHTKVLEKEGLISIKRDGFFTRFYPIGAQVSGQEMLHLKEIQEELIDIIHHQPGITQHEINNYFKISQPSISYNLTQLERNGLIRVERDGRENKYYLNPRSEEYLNNHDHQDQTQNIETTRIAAYPGDQTTNFSSESENSTDELIK